MTILTKVVDGTVSKLGSFENGNEAFELMIKDFLKEAGVDNIPEHINKNFDYNELEDLVTNYEIDTEYGYNDGEENSFFLSKGASNYYWHLSYEE